MTEAAFQEIQDRLARIEGQNLRLRWSNSALIMLVVLGLAVGGWAVRSTQALKAQTTLQARELIIVDFAGRPRVRIGTDGGLGAWIKLLGAYGYGETSLEVDSNGRSNLLMSHKRLGKVGIALDGGPAVSLSGAVGDTGLTMWVTPDGLPSLRLGNPQGSPRLEFNLLDREAMEKLLEPRVGSGGCEPEPGSDQYHLRRDGSRPESSYTPHGWLFAGQRAFEIVPAAPSPSSAVIALPPRQEPAAAGTLPEIHRLSPEVVPPVTIDEPQRWVSATTERFRLLGEVILEIVVGEDGRVLDAKMLKTPGIIGDEVVAAARKWRYKPAILNGKPVAVYLTVRLKVGCPWSNR